jgi:exodeoxyribonuclease VII large subunit
VIAKGELSLYAPRGQYQMIVRELQFAGLGELLLKFHQLKEVLEQRGWFAPQYKKPLPKLPKRIGVVTSPTGAVLQDILNVLKRRYPSFHLILCPVKVQGEGAALEIAQAIYDFNTIQGADVLIVGRGGGSIEDLWAFNEEVVAKAIFESKIPILSAVGHETDFTIADWVADVRAPTPSAAAEMVIAEKNSLLKFLLAMENNLKSRLFEQIRKEKSKILAIRRHPLFSSPYALLSQPIQQLDAIKAAFERLKPESRIIEWKRRLSPYPERLLVSILNLIRQRKERLQKIKAHFRSVHPDHLLQKGFSILFLENSTSVILSVKDLKPNQTFQAKLADGQVTGVAKEIFPNG